MKSNRRQPTAMFRSLIRLFSYRSFLDGHGQKQPEFLYAFNRNRVLYWLHHQQARA